EHRLRLLDGVLARYCLAAPRRRLPVDVPRIIADHVLTKAREAAALTPLPNRSHAGLVQSLLNGQQTKVAHRGDRRRNENRIVERPAEASTDKTSPRADAQSHGPQGKSAAHRAADRDRETRAPMRRKCELHVMCGARD